MIARLSQIQEKYIFKIPKKKNKELVSPGAALCRNQNLSCQKEEEEKKWIKYLRFLGGTHIVSGKNKTLYDILKKTYVSALINRNSRKINLGFGALARTSV